MASVKIDNLASEINSILTEYRDVVEENVVKAIEDVSKEAIEELKTTSPTGESGEYKKSWKRKKLNSKKGQYTVIVHSSEYRLTHLLEHGHALKHGGRTVGHARAFPHIEKAEKNAIDKLEKKIKETIQEAL